MYGPLFFLQTTALLTFLSLDWFDTLQSWYGMVFWPSAKKTCLDKPRLKNCQRDGFIVQTHNGIHGGGEGIHEKSIFRLGCSLKFYFRNSILFEKLPELTHV